MKKWEDLKGNMHNVSKRNRIIGVVAIVLVVVMAITLLNNSSKSAYLIMKGNRSHVLAQDTQRSSQYHIGVSQVSRTIHPYAEINQTMDILSRLVYQPLVHIQEDGIIEYAIAKNISIDNNGKTLKVNVKEGLQFSDGEAITTESIKNAYLWHLDVSNQSRYYDFVVYIEEITIVSDSEIEFRLTSNTTYIPDIMNIPIMHVVADDSQFGHTFVGSGEYQIEKMEPMSEIVLTPIKSTSHTYDQIVIQAMNYTSFDSVLEEQTNDYFLIGKEDFMEKMEKSMAYDVYEMQKDVGVYLVAKVDSTKLGQQEERQKLFSSLDTKKMIQELDVQELGIPSTGITFARKKGDTYTDGYKKSGAKIDTLTMYYDPYSISWAIAQETQRQLETKDITLEIKEMATEKDIQEGDMYLFSGNYHMLLEKYDLSDFYKRLNAIDLTDYYDALEVYLGEKSWFIPVYYESSWIASKHGLRTLHLFK